mgnify:CR=1 FL=1
MTHERKLSSVTVGITAVLVIGLAAAAWYVLDPGFRAGEETSAAVADIPRDEFERRVRDYILTHPEVIVAALRGLDAQRREAAESEAKAVIEARAEEIFRDPGSPVDGNTRGDVTLVEFFDYNCPYCRRMVPVMAEAEATDPRLRFVYKEFPILGPGSSYAARAALAAHRQERYITFHQALMAVNGPVDEDTVLAAAAEVGLDLDRLKADMTDPAVQAAIDRNLELARALRINGTPGFVVGGEILRGAVDLATLQAAIAEARERRAGAQPEGGGG